MDSRVQLSRNEKTHAQPPNFIVFGNSGVGKSSLINLIAGKDIAKTSPDAVSCTLQSTKYEINLPDHQLVNLYDTVGLEEPSIDGSGFLNALVKAHKLIDSLEKEGGLHGLIFCIRGPRITNTIQQNYRLFYEFLCDGKVPLALVITNLEGEEGDMDQWWTRNQTHIKNCGVEPSNHACITATRGIGNVYEKRYVESRTKMIKLLGILGSGTAIPVESSGWFVRICRKLRELITGNPSRRGTRAPDKKAMKKVLTTRCKLTKEVAEKLIDRIDAKT